MSITVYSKPACVQCTATTRVLLVKGLSVEVVDLTLDDAACKLVQTLGYRQAPLWWQAIITGLISGQTGSTRWCD